MRKGLISVLLFLILTACTPSEGQIEDAIEKTQTAQPTITQTPEPTKTPTIEPSPTPSYRYLRNISRTDLVNILSASAIQCGEPKVEIDETYTQFCFGSITNGLFEAEIMGNSYESISGFRITVIPYTGKDLSKVAAGIFKNAVDFGKFAIDMQTWIEENLPEIISASEGTTLTKEFSEIYIMLSGQSGTVLLGVIATK